MKKLLPLLPLMILLVLPAARAEEEAPGSGTLYVELSPSFITNYIAPQIRHFKADVTLMVENNATADAVNRNQPYIRNNLVMLFSRQTEDALQSPEGRQHLKEEALQEVLNALEAESEPTGVKEVLFTSFIVD